MRTKERWGARGANVCLKAPRGTQRVRRAYFPIAIIGYWIVVHTSSIMITAYDVLHYTVFSVLLTSASRWGPPGQRRAASGSASSRRTPLEGRCSWASCRAIDAAWRAPGPSPGLPLPPSGPPRSQGFPAWKRRHVRKEGRGGGG